MAAATMYASSSSDLLLAGQQQNAVPTKLPPFLRKLLDLTSSCPPDLGGWSDDGTHFVVRSSQFADLLREKFKATLQTFVRQLHFYSFNKKDDGKSGVWTFSHPSFLRGKPHLLMHIARKGNAKKRSKSKDDDDSESHHSDSAPNGISAATVQALETRLIYLEHQASRINSLEQELEQVKQELYALKEVTCAQNLLALAPSTSNLEMKKRTLDQASHDGGIYNMVKKLKVDDSINNERGSAENNMQSSTIPPPPKKVTRLSSLDSQLELRDFPFEDTSSVGSASMRDMMRELQTGIFSDFDELFPAQSYQQGDLPYVPSTPVSDSSAELPGSTSIMCKDKDEFRIPQNFVFQPGVTLNLLRQTFCVMAKMCCPNNSLGSTDPCVSILRDLCDQLPHPSTLPTVDDCELCDKLLPILKENVDERASDLELKKAARQVYEIYYTTMQRRLQDKVAATPLPSVSGSLCRQLSS